MKTKFYLFAILLMVGLLLSACNGEGTMENASPGDSLGSEQNQAVVESLDGTSWQLIYYRKTTVSEGIDITAIFEDGNISGSSGCNSYSGSYQVDGSKISFGPLAGTLMACMDPPEVMEMEQMYQEWLMDAQTFELSPDQLMIFRSDGEALTFVPNP